MSDAFDRIQSICNEVRKQCKDYRPTNETVVISKEFEKEIIDALRLRELHIANEMMEFLDSKRLECLPKSLNGHMLMGIKIEAEEKS